ncbi:Z1 domain-containing protein [Spinactinospora alkalitolerans]|uniref:Z1 domain-containing protein n=1 Tax=Spinactinospora alkalitolerans TaxID=687207 RepID=UPI003CD0A831
MEGLVVSYFVRSSSVYDSLLQMGRWFGYRPGYEDLPRIFMPEERRRWFTHLATVEAEMRREIDRHLTERGTLSIWR